MYFVAPANSYLANRYIIIQLLDWSVDRKGPYIFYKQLLYKHQYSAEDFSEATEYSCDLNTKQL